VLLDPTARRARRGRDGVDLRAKRLRFRYLVTPAIVVRSARQLTIGWPPLSGISTGS
jgi:hypothetical protein